MTNSKFISHSSTMIQIIATRKKALGYFEADIKRIAAQITALQNKDIASGLTQAEEVEIEGLEKQLKELGEIERRAILFDLASLDSSTSVKLLVGQIESANKELENIKTEIAMISETIKSATRFITALSGSLKSLAGLLKLLV